MVRALCITASAGSWCLGFALPVPFDSQHCPVEWFRFRSPRECSRYVRDSRGTGWGQNECHDCPCALRLARRGLSLPPANASYKSLQRATTPISPRHMMVSSEVDRPRLLRGEDVQTALHAVGSIRTDLWTERTAGTFVANFSRIFGLCLQPLRHWQVVSQWNEKSVPCWSMQRTVARSRRKRETIVRFND